MFQVLLYNPPNTKTPALLHTGDYSECINFMSTFSFKALSTEGFNKDALYELVQVIEKPVPVSQGIDYLNHFSQLEIEKAAEVWRRTGWSHFNNPGARLCK